MQIAVCCPSAEEVRRICSILEELSAATHKGVETVAFRSEDALWREFEPGKFHGAVVGYGDVKGFLCARRLREEGRTCRVVLLDDTDRYAIRGLRIHLADYLVRPLQDRQLRTAMERIFM